MKQLTIFLTLIFALSGSYFAHAQYAIVGQVTSGIDGSAPADYIFIQATNRSDKSQGVLLDSLGFFAFKNLEGNKSYTLQIGVMGYDHNPVEVTTDSLITNLHIVLNGECGDITQEQADLDWEKGEAKLLLFGSIAPIANSSRDFDFMKKYKVQYSDFGCSSAIDACIRLYNERIFELMDEQYGIDWRLAARSDVLYLWK